LKKVEVLAPAGNLASLKAAIEAGADAVYLGLRDATNARNFEGLNFTEKDLEEGLSYLRARSKRCYIVINTLPQRDTPSAWRRTVDMAVELGSDALLLANLGVLKYAREAHPDTEIHLSVQASSSNYESINFYKKHFGIKRVVLPRVLTVQEMKELKQKTDVELEVFVLGGLCINMEGRCYLSSFVTGVSTNTEGACSPSRFVRFVNNDSGMLSISLGGLLLNELPPGESSPYPTCCKGRYMGPGGEPVYAIEGPASLNVLDMLPQLVRAGVVSLKIEGRQRTKSYVASMTRMVKEAVDSYYSNPDDYNVKSGWKAQALSVFEGTSQTHACYREK
jgi:putative protease